MATKDMEERIVLDEKIMAGKPVIRGFRIPVDQVLNLLATGATYQEVLHNYPELEMADIYACLHYASRLVRQERVQKRAAGQQRTLVDGKQAKRVNE